MNWNPKLGRVHLHVRFQVTTPRGRARVRREMWRRLAEHRRWLDQVLTPQVAAAVNASKKPGGVFDEPGEVEVQPGEWRLPTSSPYAPIRRSLPSREIRAERERRQQVARAVAAAFKDWATW